MTKTIKITKQDFDNIEDAFFFFLQNCNLDPKESDSALKTMQSIIEQCLD